VTAAAGDDVKLPFPHEESSQPTTGSDPGSEEARCAAAVDYSTIARQANDAIRQGVGELETVIERLLANNEELRRQRDAALDRAEELSAACGRLTSDNLSLRGEVQRAKQELEQLHQQRVNDWKQRNLDKEKLSKLGARKSRDRQTASTVREVKDVASDLHVTGSGLRADAETASTVREVKDVAVDLHVTGSGLRADAETASTVCEVKDVAADLHVTGSSLRADADSQRQAELDLDQEGHKVMLSRSQRLPGLLGSGRTLGGQVTASERVEALPENLLAATYPPRPRPPGHHLVNTLQLPRIPHRTSST